MITNITPSLLSPLSGDYESGYLRSLKTTASYKFLPAIVMVDGKEDLDAETSSAKRSWSIQTEHRTATNGDGKGEWSLIAFLLLQFVLLD